MSDAIKHECGIAMIRLRKPLRYYQEKYGSAFYGLNKLYLLMEKQQNRGQDGAGVATIKLDVPPGQKYISRFRSNSATPIKEIFGWIYSNFQKVEKQDPELLNNPEWLKENVSFTGELLLGHLRYGTHGKNSIESCHPFLRQNNWKTRNLVLAGNFNMTNVDELFNELVELGQFPKQKADTVTVLEKIGHFLDTENQLIFDEHKPEGYSNRELTEIIADKIDVARILRRSSRSFDGGYAMAGLMGHGDAFVLRDPAGIRPAFYYADDEVVVVASERPAIQTAFKLKASQIQEIDPGKAIIIRKNGDFSLERILEPTKKLSCSFERIYFSRGTDTDIYKERKAMGAQLTERILGMVDYNLKETVFSFIPNTAEVSYFGLLQGLDRWLEKEKANKIQDWKERNGSPEELQDILSVSPRAEKVAVKDAKMRTFITQDATRDELVANSYDVTYGTVQRGVDTLVVVDDSIVRGTTLQKSILSILDRLGPKRIIVVSAAPMICYPDCYGIDMSILDDFIAFRAAIALTKERGNEQVLQDVYEKCIASLNQENPTNHVKEVYAQFTQEELERKVAEIARPNHIEAEVDIIFQSLEGIHQACPEHVGDWYFSGDFPTPGGNKVVNKAFINFMEGKRERAY